MTNLAVLIQDPWQLSGWARADVWGEVAPSGEFTASPHRQDFADGSARILRTAETRDPSQMEVTLGGEALLTVPQSGLDGSGGDLIAGRELAHYLLHAVRGGRTVRLLWADSQRSAALAAEGLITEAGRIPRFAEPEISGESSAPLSDPRDSGLDPGGTYGLELESERYGKAADRSTGTVEWT